MKKYSAHSEPNSPNPEVFHGSNEISDLLHKKDGSKKKLGSSDTWTQSLNVSLSTCLASKVPYALYWGSEFNLIYNESFSQILGDKHPLALGKKASEVWAEVWNSLGPVMLGVYETGRSVWFEDSLYLLNRSGYLEECYFSFNLSPARGFDGRVEGLIKILIETTHRVLNERRNQTLQDLASHLILARSTEDVYKLASESIATKSSDVPFGIFYSLNKERTEAKREATFGITPDHALCSKAFSLGTSTDILGLSEVIRTKSPKLVELNLSHYGRILDPSWNEPVRQVLIIPLRSVQAEASGAIVFGVNARRKLDENYQKFYSLLVGQISNALVAVTAIQDHASKQSESKFKAVAESIPQLSWMAEADGSIFWYNQLWYAYTGTTPKDMEACGWESVHDQEILRSVLEGWQQSIQAGAQFEMEVPLRGANGQFRWFLTCVVPIRNAQGQIINWFGTNTDIHDQKIALQSNMRMAAIVESSNDAIIGKDLSGIVTSWNPAAEKMFGYRREEMIGKSIWKLLPEDRVSEETSNLDKLQRGIQIHHFEAERIHKDGTRLHVLLSMFPIYDDKGKVVGIAKLARDITHDKESQAKLVEQARSLVDLQSRFKKVSQATDLGVWYCNLPFDKLIWNEKVKEHFWMDASREVAIEDVYEFLHRDDRERVRRAMADSIDGHKSYDIEYRTVRPGSPDHWKWIRAIGWTEYDAFGKPIRFDGITFDITQEKKTREELIKSQEALKNSLMQENERLEIEVRDRTLSIAKEKRLSEELSFRLNFAAAASAIGIWEWNILDNSLIWNSQMYELYGLKENNEHEPYSSWLNGLHPEDRDQAVAEIREAVEKKTKFDTEFRIVLPSGEVRRIHAQAASLLNEKGEAVRMIGVNTDVTREKMNESELLKAREEAVSASKMKSDFLANMSHEIRTPINGVIGMIGLLSDTRLLSEQREYADAAKSSAEALLTVINDILDFSKVEAGKLEFEDVDFDLLHLLQDTAKTFTFPARSKGISLSMDIDPMTPKYVGGDPGRLRQVLNNLLSNAVKFTEKGRVSIQVKAESVEANESRLRVEIKDTGIGISEKARSRMFQAFSQADSTTARRFGGTGLGLSICKHLLEKMQGTIGVESTDGQGSTFWFTLVLRSALAPEHGSSAYVRNFRDLSDRNFRILIAEDNQINQKIALRVLEKMGLSADAVANGQEVLEAHRSIPYDLILMDCQMPELDGYEATRMIRASRSLARTDIPIIAMTANAISGDKERCLSAGMNDYVSKPVKSDELFAVLKRWLLFEKSEPIAEDEAKSTADVIDRATIDYLLSLDENGDRSLLNDLIGMWLAQTPVVLELLKGALLSNDLQKIVEVFHQLKSMSGNLGALRISELSGQIEEAAHASGVSDLWKLMPQLEAAVQEAVSELEVLSRFPNSSAA